MGQTGHVMFFTNRVPRDLRQVVRRWIDLTGTESLIRCVELIGADTAWERLQEAVRRKRRAGLLVDPQILPAPATIEDGIALCDGKRTISLRLNAPALSREIGSAIGRAVPEEVRGDFVPGPDSVIAGPHDVYESSEHMGGYLFGKAFLSFTLFGHSSPNDWKACRRMILAVPEVRALKARLEEIAGPMEECVYWYA